MTTTDAAAHRSEPTLRALDGIAVVDLSRTLAGAWCSRLLADFGADVVLVEPPDGSPLRRLQPFAHDPATGTEVSVPAAYVLANKRSVTLDLATPEGIALLARLLERADVVVESGAPGVVQPYTDALEAASRAHEGLIITSITPHGQTGGREGWAGNDLTSWALSGWASVNGLADRSPLKGGGSNASMVAGIVGYAASLAALVARDRDGRGQRIDVSETDALTTTFAPSFLRSQFQGKPEARDARVDMTTGPVAVRDGYFALTISRAHFWRDAMNLLGLTDLAEDQRFEASWYRQQHKEDYVPRVEEQMAGWTKMELFDALATLRVVAGPVLTMDELAQNPHLRARAYFGAAEDSRAGPEYAGPPFRMSETPWALRRRLPRAGEHNAEVLAAPSAAPALASGGDA